MDAEAAEPDASHGVSRRSSTSIPLRVVLSGRAAFGRCGCRESCARHVGGARLASRGGEVACDGVRHRAMPGVLWRSPEASLGIGPRSAPQKSHSQSSDMAISLVIAWGPHRCPWDYVGLVERLARLPALICQLWGKSSGVAWTISWRIMAAFET